MNDTPNRKQGKKRNHKAEYARRLERGLAKDLTRAEARGHGVKLLKPKTGKALSSDRRFLEKGVTLMKSGSSLTSTAKELRVAPERLRNYLLASGVAKRVGYRWRIGPDDRIRQMLVYSRQRPLKVRVEREAASLIGAYMNDVGLFLTRHNPTFLEAWTDAHFVDVKGRKHSFETGRNVLYRLSQAGRNSFDEIYKIIT